MNKQIILETLLKRTVEGLGYQFVGVQYHPNTVNALLRVFIDKEDGIVLDDCVAVSQQISAVLDVEDPIPSKYTLEVSSPGLDRPLFSHEDFAKFVGEMIKLRLSQPIDGQRNFKGKITAIEGDEIHVLDDSGKSILFNHEHVEHARIIPKFDKQSKGKSN